jgi:hypothetical protein
MAIPFLNNIDLSDNQLLNAKLQVSPSVPTAAQGQIYFSTATNFLKPRVHDGSDWLNLLDTTSIISGTYITSTVTSNVDLTLDLSAVDGTAVEATRFLSKDNTWDIPVVDNYGSWNASDNATTEAVSSGETIKWVGAGTTGVTLSGGVFTITSNDQFVGTVTSIGAGTYVSVDSSTPATPIINVLGSTSVIASKLVARDSNGYGYVETPASGDSSDKIATTSFVQAAVTGLLEFKGGFNANTGALDAPLTTDLYTDTALQVGDYYVVTTNGNFFGNASTPLTIGDSVIVQTAKAAGSATEADFIVVQSDTDLATLTTVGIGNVNAGAGIDVAYSGGTATVSLGAQASLTFSNTGPATAGTTYQINSATHGLGTDSSKIMVQIVEISTGETIHTDVVRGVTGAIVITFANSQAINTFRALLQKIG